MALAGVIVVGAESFTYKLVFTDSNGIVSGHSFTYLPEESKAVISGKLDRKNRTFTFRETEMLYSKGQHVGAVMCLINARLNYISDKKSGTLKGSITSAQADNTACSGGTIVFNKSGELEELFAAPQKPTAKNPVDSTNKVRPKAPERENNMDMAVAMGGKKKRDTLMPIPPTVTEAKAPIVVEKITAGIEKSYEWASDSLVLEVWDGGNIDGDRISVSFNGTPYLKNYFLIKTRKQLRLPVPVGNNVITIVADNEGSDPPNTATILLRDGLTMHNVLAYNLQGQKAVIKINRAKAGQ
jgi:hypothetical protein